MKKTILLGENGMISTKTSAWLMSILGLFWCAWGAKALYENGLSIGSSGNLIIGLIFLLYSILVFTANPFAPQVTISDSEIMIRKKVFGGSTRLNWSDVQSIEFDTYLIIFHLSEGDHEFSYKTNQETSIKVKTAIREMAATKSIEVTGG